MEGGGWIITRDNSANIQALKLREGAFERVAGGASKYGIYSQVI